LANFLDPFIGQTNLWRFLFWALSIKIPLESISKPAIHIGTPDEESLTSETAPLLGFIAILGFAPIFTAIYSIMAAESYSESAITAFGFKERSSFMVSSWLVITLVPLTLAGRVTSARGSSESQSFIIWFLYPQKKSTLFSSWTKVGKTPILQSLSFLGGLSFLNLLLTLVFKLFSFTLASIGQDR